MTRFMNFLRVDHYTWVRVIPQALPRRVVTVVGAFVLAAWNRFGAQAALGPRAPVRMILTGIYGWLAWSILVWLLAAWVSSRTEGPDDRPDAKVTLDVLSFQRAAVAMTVPHFPLIIVGFYIATFGSFIRSPIPGIVIVVIAFAVWIPALVIRAFQHLTDINRPIAAGLMLLPYLLWLGTIGRYLFNQVGHLI